jgi:hypothetical protein
MVGMLPRLAAAAAVVVVVVVVVAAAAVVLLVPLLVEVVVVVAVVQWQCPSLLTLVLREHTHLRLQSWTRWYVPLFAVTTWTSRRWTTRSPCRRSACVRSYEPRHSGCHSV